MSVRSSEIIGSARTLTVKIGSSLLVDPATGILREDWLGSLAEDIKWLKSKDKNLILVSSGAIALGRAVLGLPAGRLSLEQAQAAAAVGQIRLARAYETALSPLTTAQVLVTLEDSQNRRRYLNSRATIATLLSLGTIPIVNENDTVATDEIRFGDNDRLAAQVASLAGADALVLLSDIDGLYTGNPRVDGQAKRIETVTEITPEIEAMAGDAGTEGAKGGMRTKVMAAGVAMKAGTSMAIAKGATSNPLRALMEGAPATWFLSEEDPRAARKMWISSMKPKGRVIVDGGAAKALREGRSLLPAGVAAVEGDFQRGDPVDILGEHGAVLGRGLVAYDHREAAAIIGAQTRDIAAILGHPARAALIHRDNMAI